MGSGPQAGAIVGAMVNGFLCPRYGFKPMFLGAMVLMIAFVFVSVFGNTVELQAVGQILCGLVCRFASIAIPLLTYIQHSVGSVCHDWTGLRL